MRTCLIICAALLAGCGGDATRPVAVPSQVPADLFQAVPGWQGPTPRREADLALAAAAEMQGRQQCNADKLTIAEIWTPPG